MEQLRSRSACGGRVGAALGLCSRPMVGLGLALILLTGCSDLGGGHQVQSTMAVTPPSPTVRPAVEVTHVYGLRDREVVGEVTGRLPRERRRVVLRSVTRLCDGWLDAAFLSGSYPRSRFRNAFPGFTTGARRDARADLALMTNADIGSRIDGVQALRRSVRVDVLAGHRHAAAVTAHVLLVFRTAGDLANRVTVSGRLFLTRTRAGWRVFGYDVVKARR